MKARGRSRHSLIAAALLATGATALAAAPGIAGASGSAARTVSLNDTGHLHKTAHHGLNLYEAGPTSGSLSGTVTLHLDVVSTNRVTAQLTVHSGHSSINATASGSYRNNGPTASFSGTLSVTGGTGSYAHAHGSGLSFSGTIQRTTDAVTVRVSGHFSA